MNRTRSTYTQTGTGLEMPEGRWTLWAGWPDERTFVWSCYFTDVEPTAAELTDLATQALYGKGVRATEWHQIDDDTWQPTTAAARGMWEVTTYAELGSGLVWRRTQTGWISRTGVVNDAGLRARGPLVPLAVTGLAALIAEVEIARARATLLIGPEECAEGDCEEQITAQAEGRTLDLCSHMTMEVAAASDVCAFRRVLATLDELSDPATADCDMETLGAGVAHAVEQIRYAIAESGGA